MRFLYIDEGIRTSKTVNGVTTTYYLSSSTIIAEETSGNLTTDAMRFALKADDVIDAVDDIHDTSRAIDRIDYSIDISRSLSKSAKKHGNSLDYDGISYGYVLIDKDKNILKFGETIHPNKRYTKKYLRENQYRMIVLEQGSKIDMHLWQNDLNMYYKFKYGVFPPLNKRGW